MPKQHLQGMDLKLLLKFALCFSSPKGNSDALASWGFFPPAGRIFLTDLQKRSSEVRQIIKKFANLDSRWIRNLRGQYVSIEGITKKMEELSMSLYNKNLFNLDVNERRQIELSSSKWRKETWMRELLQFFSERESPVSVAQKV